MSTGESFGTPVSRASGPAQCAMAKPKNKKLSSKVPEREMPNCYFVEQPMRKPTSDTFRIQTARIDDDSFQIAQELAGEFKSLVDGQPTIWELWSKCSSLRCRLPPSYTKCIQMGCMCVCVCQPLVLRVSPLSPLFHRQGDQGLPVTWPDPTKLQSLVREMVSRDALRPCTCRVLHKLLPSFSAF